MARSRLHTVFQNLISFLKQANKTIANAQQCKNQRTWEIPDDFVGDVQDIPNIHKPSFDRTEINTNYLECHSGDADNEAGVGDAGSLKIQLDYVAVAERAFRSRHASHLRCLAHAAARYAGHANDQGAFSSVQNYAQDLSKVANG